MSLCRQLTSCIALAACLTLSPVGMVFVSADGPDPRTSSQAAKETLTLAQAVAEALLHNDRIAGQLDSTEQAALSVRLAKNNFQPKIVPNIQGSFGQTDIANQTYRVDLLQRFTSGSEVRLGVGTASAQIPSTIPGEGDVHYYNADTTLTFSQPLLRGFGPSVARRALTSAEVRQADAARQKSLTEQQVALDVAAQYYRLVAQQTLIDVARRGLDRSRKLREASEAKLDVGSVSQLDVFRAQELVAQAEIQLFDSEAAAEDARDQLCYLTGREPGVPFDVVAAIPRVTASMDVEAAIAIAMEKRVDLQSAIATAADAARSISFARNQLLPQFDVNLALTRRETADTFLDSFSLKGYRFATFFTITMPIDRTPQIVDYQTALINRDRGQREIEMLRRRIANDVRRAVREADRAARGLAAAEFTVNIARQEVEVAQARYERGLSNNLDVVTAQVNLLNAESRQISALAEQALGQLTLRATVGVFDPRTDLQDRGAGGRTP
jgi:outer membrane protein